MASDIVYECWVRGEPKSFAKMTSDDKFGVIRWLINVLPQLPENGHVHIVRHNRDEYDN